MQMRKVTAPDPSRWTIAARNTVPIQIFMGSVPTTFRILLIIGLNVPASEHNAGSCNGTDTCGAGDESAELFEVGCCVDDVRSVLRISNKEEAGNDSGHHRYRNEGYQRGKLLCHDQYEHQNNGDKA